MEWFHYNQITHALTWTKEALQEFEEIQFISEPSCGEIRKKGDALLEVESSKAVYEIEAPFDLKVLKEGDKDVVLYVNAL